MEHFTIERSATKKTLKLIPLFAIALFMFFPSLLKSHAEVLLESSVTLESETAVESKVTIRPGHHKALQSLGSYENESFKTIQVTMEVLQDSQGLVYLGGKVSRADLISYLTKMQQVLGNDHKTYRLNQARRDQNTFHLTVLTPKEYRTADKSKLKIGQAFPLNLFGLGHVKNEGSSSYFVVASSMEGTFLRQQLLLPAKDFHITLGFEPVDIYDMRKGKSTLIN
jgi:hypothetical protein